MKLAIVGSRSFTDYNLLASKVLTLVQFSDITCVVSGGARGADALAERFAQEYGVATEIFLPDWAQFGKSAGFKRNVDIITCADIVIAFWNGESKGTLHSINLARKLGKKLFIVEI